MSSREADDNLEKNNKSNKNKKVIILIVIFALVIGLIVLLINLFRERSTYTSSGTETTSTESLYCTTKSTNIDGAFFDLTDASSAEQAIKVIFKNKKINDISYNATIKYIDTDTATNKQAELNVKYGKYVQDNGKNMSVFTPNFSVSGNEVIISLNANIGDLNTNLAKIFLIDTTENSLNNYTSKVLSTLYKSKGFKCESKE